MAAVLVYHKVAKSGLFLMPESLQVVAGQGIART
jgi:hypothetical protein